jgi:hypothetical protein
VVCPDLQCSRMLTTEVDAAVSRQSVEIGFAGSALNRTKRHTYNNISASLEITALRRILTPTSHHSLPGVWHRHQNRVPQVHFPTLAIDTPPPDSYPHSPHPLDPRHRLGAPAQSLGRGYEVLRNFEVRSSFSVHRVFSVFTLHSSYSSCSGLAGLTTGPHHSSNISLPSLAYLT